jgi:hypothetical protein
MKVSEEDASSFTVLMNWKWPNGARCPHCRSKEHSFNSKRLIFQCRNCRKQYSLTTGTKLHATRLKPLKLLVMLLKAFDATTGYCKRFKTEKLTVEMAFPVRMLMETLGTKSVSSTHRIYRLLGDELAKLPKDIEFKDFVKAMLSSP